MKEKGRNINSYYHNPDHYSYEIYEAIDFIASNLKLAMKAQNVKDEMYYWMNVAIGFMDMTIWQTNIDGMIAEGKVEDIDLSQNGGLFTKLNRLYTLYHNFGMGILIYIVSPYIKHSDENLQQ